MNTKILRMLRKIYLLIKSFNTFLSLSLLNLIAFDQSPQLFVSISSLEDVYISFGYVPFPRPYSLLVISVS